MWLKIHLIFPISRLFSSEPETASLEKTMEAQLILEKTEYDEKIKDLSSSFGRARKETILNVVREVISGSELNAQKSEKKTDF